MWIVFAAAVVPALLLLYFVYSKDFYPEPKRLVFKGFGFGALAVFASLFISVPIQAAGLFTQNPGTLSEAVGLSFMGAAIPEESAKLFMLWLLLRNCPEFDERYDGLVYAAAVGLGFAAVENLMYVVSSGAGWFSVSVTRALFAVPGHFSFAIVMGYFYSRAHFGQSRMTKLEWIKAWLFPVLLHGAYDTLAISSGLGAGWSGLMSLGLLAFCFFLFRNVRRRILSEAGASKKTQINIDHGQPDTNNQTFRPRNRDGASL